MDGRDFGFEKHVGRIEHLLRSIGLKAGEVKNWLEIISSRDYVDYQAVQDSIDYLVLMRYEVVTDAFRHFGLSPFVEDVYRDSVKRGWFSMEQFSQWGYSMTEETLGGKSDAFLVLMTNEVAEANSISLLPAYQAATVCDTKARIGPVGMATTYSEDEFWARMRCIGVSGVKKAERTDSVVAEVAVEGPVAVEDTVSASNIVAVDFRGETGFSEGFCYLSLVAAEHVEEIAAKLGAKPTFEAILDLPVEYVDPDWLRLKVSCSESCYHVGERGHVDILHCLRALSVDKLDWSQGSFGALLAKAKSLEVAAVQSPRLTDVVGGIGDCVGAELADKLEKVFTSEMAITSVSYPLEARFVRSGDFCAAVLFEKGVSVGVIPLVSLEKRHVQQVCLDLVVLDERGTRLLCLSLGAEIFDKRLLGKIVIWKLPLMDMFALIRRGRTQADAVKNLRSLMNGVVVTSMRGMVFSESKETVSFLRRPFTSECDDTVCVIPRKLETVGAEVVLWMGGKEEEMVAPFRVSSKLVCLADLNGVRIGVHPERAISMVRGRLSLGRDVRVFLREAEVVRIELN